MSNDLAIFSYASNGKALAKPTHIPAQQQKESVVDLASHRRTCWHTGHTLCTHCGLHYMALVEAAEMPRRLHCPRCAQPQAVPQDYWGPSCQAWCTTCGNAWKIVYADVPPPEILPRQVQCSKCGGTTDRLEPWPLPS